jgi:hypothetical protein
MSVLAQRRVIDFLQDAGFFGPDERPDAGVIMGGVGALAERAYMPVQHLNEREDKRLLHQDLAEMGDRGLWREMERARFVAAWGDDRTGWVWERIQAIQTEQAKRKTNGR